MFFEMKAIVEEMPDLEGRVAPNIQHKSFEVLDGPGRGSTYEALSRDSKRSHGLAPSFWAYDELGQCQERGLLDALMTAMGKQPRAIGVVLSTQSAEDDHPLSDLIDRGLEGEDPSMYVQLHAAPEGADPLDPAVWAACNPALGIFLDRKEFEDQARQAARSPVFMSAFRNLRLNQRVHAVGHLIQPDDWKACGGVVDPAALRGRRCWGGLDLSSTTDLSAFTLVFDGDPAPVLAWFWMPAGSVDHLAHEDHRTYRLWIEQGFIETTPGRAIDKRAIALRLAEVTASYQLEALGFDEWRFADLLAILDEREITLPLRPMRQGFKTMAGCVDALEAGVVDRGIVHPRNPVLDDVHRERGGDHGPDRGPVTVVVNVTAADASSFRASQGEIAADMARAIDRASRNR